jgi:hypothetical protein
MFGHRRINRPTTVIEKIRMVATYTTAVSEPAQPRER